MWQYELAPSAGSAEIPTPSTYPMSDFLATFTFAEGVALTLSLPWSLFEHMAGNWLATVVNPLEPVRLEILTRQNLENPSLALWNEVQLPAMTAGKLEQVLQSGRRYFDAVASDSWMGEGDPAAHVMLGV